MAKTCIGRVCKIQGTILLTMLAGTLSQAAATPLSETMTSPSPDGKLLAFAAPKINPDGDSRAVSVMVCEPDGANLREVTTISGNCTGLTWLGNHRLACAII